VQAALAQLIEDAARQKLKTLDITSEHFTKHAKPTRREDQIPHEKATVLPDVLVEHASNRHAQHEERDDEHVREDVIGILAIRSLPRDTQLAPHHHEM